MSASSLCDQWLSAYYGKLPYHDYVLLDRAARTLEGNSGGLREGRTYPWSPLRGIMPSIVGFRGVWNWDCAFQAIGCSHWDTTLARDQIDVFINLQKESGLFPDVLRENGELVDRFGKPPVLGWAALRVYERDADRSFLERAYSAVVRNEAFWWRERGGEAHGLFHYDSAATEFVTRLKEARYETGWDNAVRWDGGVWEYWPIDLNCYMVMTYRSLARMAELLGEANEASLYTCRATALSKRIETDLWNESIGAYTDYDFGRKLFSGVLSPASFMPLFIGIADRERAERMAVVAREHFIPGWPSVSYKDPAFEPTGYWRGRTWLNVAYFALKGLKGYGFDDLADTGRETLLEWVRRDPGAIYENYNPVNGNPLGEPHFSWSSAFVIEFLLNWDS